MTQDATRSINTDGPDAKQGRGCPNMGAVRVPEYSSLAPWECPGMFRVHVRTHVWQRGECRAEEHDLYQAASIDEAIGRIVSARYPQLLRALKGIEGHITEVFQTFSISPKVDAGMLRQLVQKAEIELRNVLFVVEEEDGY